MVGNGLRSLARSSALAFVVFGAPSPPSFSRPCPPPPHLLPLRLVLCTIILSPPIACCPLLRFNNTQVRLKRQDSRQISAVESSFYMTRFLAALEVRLASDAVASAALNVCLGGGGTRGVGLPNTWCHCTHVQLTSGCFWSCQARVRLRREKNNELQQVADWFRAIHCHYVRLSEIGCLL